MFCNNSSPTNNRLVNISEQSFDPVRIPVIIGNEMYLITQQDVRNIIDTRFISCTKLQSNGLQARVPQGLSLQDIINNAINMGQQIQPKLAEGFIVPTQHTPNLGQILFPSPTNTSAPPQTIAPIQTQLDWEMKCVQNEQPLSQFTFCKKTSTTDLEMRQGKVHFTKQETPKFKYCLQRFTCTGTNVSDEDLATEGSPEPSARKLLKQKKINESPSL